MQVAELDYVARAPKGKEVEELIPKEILRCIREKVPIEQIKGKKPTKPPADVPKHIFETAQELRGTLEAVLFDKKGKTISKIPVSELAEKLSQTDSVDTVLFDGIVTQRLLDMADEKKVKSLIGDRVAEAVKIPVDIKIMKLSEIIGE
jgi:DNA primase